MSEEYYRSSRFPQRQPAHAPKHLRLISSIDRNAHSVGYLFGRCRSNRHQRMRVAVSERQKTRRPSYRDLTVVVNFEGPRVSLFPIRSMPPRPSTVFSSLAAADCLPLLKTSCSKTLCRLPVEAQHQKAQSCSLALCRETRVGSKRAHPEGENPPGAPLKAVAE